MLRIINQAIISAGIIGLLATAAYAEGKQVEQGRKLYVEYCASCHGMSGTGDGPVSRALTTPVLDDLIRNDLGQRVVLAARDLLMLLL